MKGHGPVAPQVDHASIALQICRTQARAREGRPGGRRQQLRRALQEFTIAPRFSARSEAARGLTPTGGA